MHERNSGAGSGFPLTPNAVLGLPLPTEVADTSVGLGATALRGLE
jgi:hypothetical protein